MQKKQKKNNLYSKNWYKIEKQLKVFLNPVVFNVYFGVKFDFFTCQAVISCSFFKPATSGHLRNCNIFYVCLLSIHKQNVGFHQL